MENFFQEKTGMWLFFHEKSGMGWRDDNQFGPFRKSKALVVWLAQRAYHLY